MDARESCTFPDLQKITVETAAALERAVAAGQPITTKLITTCIASMLRDEQTIADLLHRSMLGENAFAALVRAVIADEAEQIAQIALAAPRAA